MEKRTLQTFPINDDAAADNDKVDDDGHLHFNVYDDMMQLIHNTPV